MTAARQQAEEGRLERRPGCEVQRRDVGVQVVDRGQRQPSRPGERLRRCDADEEGSDRPGPRVTATSSTSSSDASASSSASSTTGTASSRCRREATSGTTPP